MRKILFLLTLFFVLIISSGSFAAYVSNEALVVIRVPEGVELNDEYFKSEEFHEYVNSVLSEAEAEVVRVYEALSWADGKINLHVRSETKNSDEIIEILKKNPDVITVSKNRVGRIRRNNMKKSYLIK